MPIGAPASPGWSCRIGTPPRSTRRPPAAIDAEDSQLAAQPFGGDRDVDRRARRAASHTRHRRCSGDRCPRRSAGSARPCRTTTIAPAGAATFIVPMIRLRDGSSGCTQIAGSSGSLESGAVPYSASISTAFDSGEGAGGGLVESSSATGRSRRHPAGRSTAPCRPPARRSRRSASPQNLNFKPS